MSKYQMIVEWVQQNIAEGKFLPGTKLPIESDLAEQFHVSRQTVRKALEVLEQCGDVKSRQGSGTFVLDKTRAREERSKRVALVTTYIDNYIFPKIIDGIERNLFAQGYQVQIYFTNNKGSREDAVLRDLLTLDLSGIIIETTKSALPNPNIHLYKKLMERNIPILFINSRYQELDIPMISLEDEKAGRDMVQYLVDKGHTDIGGIFKLDDGQGLRRYRGYVKALIANGLPVRAKQVTWVDTEDMINLDKIEEKIISRLDGCTAVACYNDQLAYSVVELFKKNQIQVPNDISVISVDNTELADMGDVGLTSIHHPKQKLGEKTAQILLEMMKYGSNGYTYEFHGEVVERESVKAIN